MAQGKTSQQKGQLEALSARLAALANASPADVGAAEVGFTSIRRGGGVSQADLDRAKADAEAEGRKQGESFAASIFSGEFQSNAKQIADLLGKVSGLVESKTAVEGQVAELQARLTEVSEQDKKAADAAAENAKKAGVARSAEAVRQQQEVIDLKAARDALAREKDALAKQLAAKGTSTVVAPAVEVGGGVQARIAEALATVTKATQEAKGVLAGGSSAAAVGAGAAMVAGVTALAIGAAAKPDVASPAANLESLTLLATQLQGLGTDLTNEQAKTAKLTAENDQLVQSSKSKDATIAEEASARQKADRENASLRDEVERLRATNKEQEAALVRETAAKEKAENGNETLKSDKAKSQAANKEQAAAIAATTAEISDLKNQIQESQETVAEKNGIIDGTVASVLKLVETLEAKFAGKRAASTSAASAAPVVAAPPRAVTPDAERIKRVLTAAGATPNTATTRAAAIAAAGPTSKAAIPTAMQALLDTKRAEQAATAGAGAPAAAGGAGAPGPLSAVASTRPRTGGAAR